jgi:asparagine synthase (glutamine-hydrolysing)
MSAILGVFGPAGILPDDTRTARMLTASRRGDGPVAVLRGDHFVLGVRRHTWETVPGLGGPAEVATDGSVAVVTDAALYHVADLRRRLRAAGFEPRGDTPAHCVLAAYRAWGSALPEKLDGDFAFILWDGDVGRALCARDFAGKRPLVYAQADAGLVIGSTVATVLAHPLVADGLNPVSIAETAAALWQGNDETAYRAIRRLQPARTLAWRAGESVRITLHWEPPAQGSAASPDLERDGEELRELLCAAAAERFPDSGTAAVWMSGGWDSSAVFAAGQESLRRGAGTGRRLEIVSVSYPPGDPGREDEQIAAIAGHWSKPVHWLDIASIPLFDRPAERAALRDEPFAHAFEMWNRALIGRTRELGSRVAFDGNGGDQLFFTSNVFFADLLVRGHWRELRREWRTKGGTAFHDFFANAVRPILPAALLDLAGALRGRPFSRVFERNIPSWIRRDFARAHDLVGRERRHSPRPRGGGLAAREAYWYVMAPYFARAYGLLASFALEAGVELRSPLLDRRVVEFAAARPRAERNAGREIKRLLRRAMKGLLPEETLAPRDAKTGTLEGYFGRSMQRDFPALANAAIEDARLADMGIIEPNAFRAALAEYARTGNGRTGYALLQTVQVELWLRARQGASVSSESAARPIALRSGHAVPTPPTRPHAVANRVAARSL